MERHPWSLRCGIIGRVAGEARRGDIGGGCVVADAGGELVAVGGVVQGGEGGVVDVVGVVAVGGGDGFGGVIGGGAGEGGG